MTALWFACAPGSATDADPVKDEGSARSWRDRSGVFFAFDVTDFAVIPTAPGHPEENLKDSSVHRSEGFTQALDRAATLGQPFIVEPSSRDTRMTVQQGLFLAGSVPALPSIPGLDAFAIDAQEPPGDEQLKEILTGAPKKGNPRRLPFVALVVKPAIKKKLRPHLEKTYAKSRATLFPDFAGLRDSFSLEVADFSPK